MGIFLFFQIGIGAVDGEIRGIHGGNLILIPQEGEGELFQSGTAIGSFQHHSRSSLRQIDGSQGDFPVGSTGLSYLGKVGRNGGVAVCIGSVVNALKTQDQNSSGICRHSLSADLIVSGLGRHGGELGLVAVLGGQNFTGNGGIGGAAYHLVQGYGKVIPSRSDLVGIRHADEVQVHLVYTGHQLEVTQAALVPVDVGEGDGVLSGSEVNLHIVVGLIVPLHGCFQIKGLRIQIIHLHPKGQGLADGPVLACAVRL